jgi:hypothetical protein
MKMLSLLDAEKSADVDIKLVAVRSSRYRVFGSTERIQGSELAIVDLRDGVTPPDFEKNFVVLERHPVVAVMLVKKIGVE